MAWGGRCMDNFVNTIMWEQIDTIHASTKNIDIENFANIIAKEGQKDFNLNWISISI